jgi:hypothetical protein
MKSKLILAGVMVVVSLCLLGCAPAAEEEVTRLGIFDVKELYKGHDIVQETEVAVGDEFTVPLVIKGSTFWKWWLPSMSISDPTVLELTDHELLTGWRGGELGEHDEFTFKALKKGTSTFYIEYAREWGEDIGYCTYTLNVVVK